MTCCGFKISRHSRCEVFGSGTRACPIKAYFDKNGERQVLTAKSVKEQARRDCKLIELMWLHCPKKELQTLEEESHQEF